MAKAQTNMSSQQGQNEKSNKGKFPPYFDNFNNEESKDSLYFRKVSASSKENVRCKPYIDNYSATADHKRQPTPYYCCLTGFEIIPGKSPYAVCMQCVTRNKFKDTPYCKCIEEAESKFKY